MSSIKIDPSQHDIVNLQARIDPNNQVVPQTQVPHDNVGVAGAARGGKGINLFDTSTIDALPSSLKMANGNEQQLNALSPDDKENIQSLFGSVPQDQQGDITHASDRLGTALFSLLQTSAATTVANGSPQTGLKVLQATPQVQEAVSHAALAYASATNINAQLAQVAASHAAAQNQSSTDGLSDASLDLTNAKTSSSRLATTLIATQAPANTAAQQPANHTALPQSGPSHAAPSKVLVSQATPNVAINGATTASNSGSQGKSGNYDSTVAAVAYMGVAGFQNQLQTYASNMQTTINHNQAIASDQNEIGTAIAEWPAGQENTPETFTYHTYNSDTDTFSETTASLTKSQAQQVYNDLSATASSLGSDTQMQQIQLQNIMQNYQTGISMISNLLKASYDTAKNTLSNIKY